MPYSFSPAKQSQHYRQPKTHIHCSQLMYPTQHISDTDTCSTWQMPDTHRSSCTLSNTHRCMPYTQEIGSCYFTLLECVHYECFVIAHIQPWASPWIMMLKHVTNTQLIEYIFSATACTVNVLYPIFLNHVCKHWYYIVPTLLRPQTLPDRKSVV